LEPAKSTSFTASVSAPAPVRQISNITNTARVIRCNVMLHPFDALHSTSTSRFPHPPIRRHHRKVLARWRHGHGVVVTSKPRNRRPVGTYRRQCRRQTGKLLRAVHNPPANERQNTFDPADRIGLDAEVIITEHRQVRKPTNRQRPLSIILATKPCAP